MSPAQLIVGSEEFETWCHKIRNFERFTTGTSGVMNRRRGSAFVSTYPQRQNTLQLNSPCKPTEPQPLFDQYQTSNFGLRKPDELDIQSMMPLNLKHYKSCTNRFKRLVSNNKLLRPQTQGALNETLLTKDEQLKSIVRHLVTRPQTQQSGVRCVKQKSALSDKNTALSANSPGEAKQQTPPGHQSNGVLSLSSIPQAQDTLSALASNLELKKHARSTLDKFQIQPRSPTMMSAQNVGVAFTHTAASRTPSPNGLLDVNTKHMHVGLRQDLSTIQTELNTVNQFLLHRNNNAEESEDCSDQPSLLVINKDTLSAQPPQITLKITKPCPPPLAESKAKRIVLKQVEPLKTINFSGFEMKDQCLPNDFYTQLVGPLREARRVINSRQATSGLSSQRQEFSCDSNQSASRGEPEAPLAKGEKLKTAKVAVRNKVFSIDYRVQADLAKNKLGGRAQINRRFKSQRPFLYPTKSS